ncbi:hypothetical protein EVAR_13319_1 [Eumeta japonica]|uniref:Uncharacterized protein n=1 Tax=Eumeta variegata TaxID=151549 RepID=A0A4C1TRT1_EUMVA|nr:hypothetical protein EVAR_13319_1 [Eumeta japonica]
MNILSTGLDEISKLVRSTPPLHTRLCCSVHTAASREILVRNSGGDHANFEPASAPPLTIVDLICYYAQRRPPSSLPWTLGGPPGPLWGILV